MSVKSSTELMLYVCKNYRQTYKAKLKTCLDVAYVVGDTSNWAYDDHKNSNVAIKICGYYSQYWYLRSKPFPDLTCPHANTPFQTQNIVHAIRLAI
jgi:hypothetical protein